MPEQPVPTVGSMGNGYIVYPSKELLRVVHCGCWIIRLAQGSAVVCCPVHEPEIMKVVERKPVLESPVVLPEGNTSPPKYAM